MSELDIAKAKAKAIRIRARARARAMEMEAKASADLRSELSDMSPKWPLPSVSTAEDMAKSGGIGLVKGALALPNMAPDLTALTGMGVGKVAGMMGFDPQAADDMTRRAVGAGYMLNPITAPMMLLPGSAESRSAIEDNVTGPFYEPQTTAGKYAESVGTFLPGMALPNVGPVRGGIGALTGGVGAEGAGQLTEGTPYEPYARFGGGLLGMVSGHGIGGLLGKGMMRRGMTPEDIAAEKIHSLVEKSGGVPAVEKRMADLGDDAIVADAMGKRGIRLGRAASNFSPEADELLSGAVLGRKAGQNQRLVAALEKAAGLAGVKRGGLEEYKDAVYGAARPGINRAYDAARAAGAKLPLRKILKDIGTPEVKSALRKASAKMQSINIATGQPIKQKNALSRLDLAKRYLDDSARSAGRAGENTDAMAYSGVAKELRNRIDDAMRGGEYELARALREKAYKADEAIDIGAELGSGKLDFNTLRRAEEAAVNNMKELGRGYVIRKSEKLLKSGNRDDVLNELTSPSGRRAYKAALKDASGVEKVAAAERQFNITARGLTGNSTTAQQGADLLSSGMDGMGAAIAAGGDALSGGGVGVLMGLLRRGGPNLAKAMASKKKLEMAPIVAKMLTDNKLPKKYAAPKFLEKMTEKDRTLFLRAFIAGMSQGRAPVGDTGN